MQVLTPPRTESITNQDGHFIKTFLISTKPNQAGWQISKETGHKMVQSFIGKPFVIIPEHLSSQRQKGHVFANSKEELQNAYNNHTHGIIESISSPFFYGDGTDDYFYMGNVKLSNSKAAAALMEYGPKTWTPFAVSPHIWPNDNNDITTDWEGIGLALVTGGEGGAYGPDAIVTKYCKGETDSCTKSLAATKLCDKEDTSLAASIESIVQTGRDVKFPLLTNKDSSLVLNNESKPIMSTQTVQELNPNTQQVKEVQEPKQPIKQDDSITLTKADFEALNKQLEQKKEQEEQLKSLISENKTTKLNNIFKSVKDESLKKTLTEKYFNADVNQLNEFYSDVTNHVFPSLLEESKAQAEQELKNKTIEENKGKSKAASSLPKEPEVPKEETKVVPKSENEILKLSKMINGGL